MFSNCYHHDHVKYQCWASKEKINIYNNAQRHKHALYSKCKEKSCILYIYCQNKIVFTFEYKLFVLFKFICIVGNSLFGFLWESLFFLRAKECSHRSFLEDQQQETCDVNFFSTVLILLFKKMQSPLIKKPIALS